MENDERDVPVEERAGMLPVLPATRELLRARGRRWQLLLWVLPAWISCTVMAVRNGAQVIAGAIALGILLTAVGLVLFTAVSSGRISSTGGTFYRGERGYWRDIFIWLSAYLLFCGVGLFMKKTPHVRPEPAERPVEVAHPNGGPQH